VLPGLWAPQGRAPPEGSARLHCQRRPVGAEPGHRAQGCAADRACLPVMLLTARRVAAVCFGPLEHVHYQIMHFWGN
jgi:hypothetical protein